MANEENWSRFPFVFESIHRNRQDKVDTVLSIFCRSASKRERIRRHVQQRHSADSSAVNIAAAAFPSVDSSTSASQPSSSSSATQNTNSTSYHVYDGPVCEPSALPTLLHYLQTEHHLLSSSALGTILRGGLVSRDTPIAAGATALDCNSALTIQTDNPPTSEQPNYENLHAQPQSDKTSSVGECCCFLINRLTL